MTRPPPADDRPTRGAARPATMSTTTMLRYCSPGRPKTADDPALHERNLGWYLLVREGIAPEVIAAVKGVHLRTVRRALDYAAAYIAAYARAAARAESAEAVLDESPEDRAERLAKNLLRRRTAPRRLDPLED